MFSSLCLWSFAALIYVCLLAEPIMGAVCTTHHDDPHHPLPRLQPGFHGGEGVTHTGVVVPPVTAIVCVGDAEMPKLTACSFNY